MAQRAAPWAEPLPPDPLLRVPDINGQTGWGRSMIYDLIRTRRLKTVRVGRTVRVRQSDLDAFVAANTYEDADPIPRSHKPSKPKPTKAAPKPAARARR